MERARGHAVTTHRYCTVTFMTHMTAMAESEDMRWRQWQAKGRAADTRFRRLARTIFVDVAGVAAVGAALWFAFLA